MSDQIEDIPMYAEQWTNVTGENVYVQPNRNIPSANKPNVLQHHQYLLSRQPHHPNTYSSGAQYSNSDTNSMEGAATHTGNGNAFGTGAYDRGNPNFSMNYNPVDLNNVLGINAELYKDQYNAMNMNDYEMFGHDMDQFNQQHYAMMFNTMKHMPPNQCNVDDGMSYIPEHLMPVPASQRPHLPSSASIEESVHAAPKSQLIDNFLVNWTSNPSGTYTPFGHSYLNVQPNLLLQKENVTPNTRSNNSQISEMCISTSMDPDPVKLNEPFQRKDSDGISFSDVGGKKRIVAEVKPMRPSYSAVLSKTPRTNNTPEVGKKKETNKEFVKTSNSTKETGRKQDKFKNLFISNEKPLSSDEKLKKSEAEKRNILYSQGSETGENNVEFGNKTNKNKTKNENTGGKYISLDDLMNDDDAQLLEEKPGYNNCDSEFVFLTQPEEKIFSRKRNTRKTDGTKNKNVNKREDTDLPNKEGGGEEVFQDLSTESDKLKRKNRESKSSSNARKILAEKNKKNSQGRNKKPKNGGYLGKMQNLFDRWMIIIKNVLIWFYNLLSDIFRMSAQLSVDFASVSCTTTYNWASDIFISIKDKATSPQWLKDFVGYIDKKMGHTWVGFWRNMKFLNFLKFDDDKNTQKQSNTNIPLPATGDEAMKRLLACKGKDPYSILGVGAQCSDEDIKRYYRRQAFLVHPDKNQQPGAEEAFKILQHAFDLIGVPTRREAYDRKLVESAQMEAALSEVAELLAQLQDKVKHAAGTIRCTNCCRRHVRTITSRPAYAARYCQQCKIRHAAKEGDIWAESQLWGLVWKYYACMDGAVYQITQWASCQKKNLKHLVANTHHVQYRIVLGNNRSPPNTSAAKQNFNSSSHDANLEDFLNNLYTKTGQNPGETRNVSTANSSGEANKNRRKTKKCKS